MDDPDPAALKSLLVLQTGLHTPPDDEGMARLLADGLLGLPGVAGVAVCKDRRILGAAGGPPIRSLDPSETCGKPAGETSSSRCPREGNGYFRLGLHTPRCVYGGLLLNVADPAAFSACRPYVESLAEMAARIMECREREAGLRERNQMLGERIRECGGDLRNELEARRRAEEENDALERKVRQAQKLESLGVLAGGIAHDFNNLLMVILGNAELALKGISPLSPARESISEILAAGRRASELCRQMLAYAGKSSFARERLDLSVLVEEMAHLLSSAVSKKAILNLHTGKHLSPILGDPSQLRQVVMNLILNASEAIGDRSGVITVLTGATRCDAEYLRKTELADDLAPGYYVHLEVSDTGCGIDPETRARIFEPFFTTKFTGRGLGLSAVLGIVRAHKGAIKVYTEPGKGTTFKILLPAVPDDKAAAGSAGNPAPAAWRGKGTILLVEDEESLSALGARMLEHLGFDVLTASDGRAAVERYREKSGAIDLVLMDLTMPHMDGAEALGELRRLNPNVRIVMSSGYSKEDLAARFAAKGIEGVLQKPFTLAALRELLSGLMPARTGEE
ncbi:MAG: hypothetical protein OHK0028_17850 [Deltaproteobacteria bacterium]